MPTPPQALVLLLPVPVTLLSGWLNHDRLAAWLNATISLLVVLLCAALWALISQSLVSDLIADITLIAAYCAALMAGPLAPLHQWLVVKALSPFALFVSAARPTPIAAQPARIAQAQPPIAARASQLAPARSWAPGQSTGATTMPTNAVPRMAPAQPAPIPEASAPFAPMPQRPIPQPPQTPGSAGLG